MQSFCRAQGMWLEASDISQSYINHDHYPAAFLLDWQQAGQERH
jgi:hypothetical protein